MPVERETIIERPVRDETVVVSGGSPFGIIGGVIAVLVVLLVVFWLMNGGMSGGGGSVNVDLPEVSVTP
jgi:hypothetical protein